ncbi:hypothetical protein HF325_005562 [Metschnikowia pulcherrima]|uniref:Uncharacterized protein n=1 Tax=Metschnikowia pulcherrima TaxID=27326 RepID=A0A8H7L9D8_9ASCO|nr:hypothetical protein HF325_005562 [Metschnikowia pulcherrima]
MNTPNLNFIRWHGKAACESDVPGAASGEEQEGAASEEGARVAASGEEVPGAASEEGARVAAFEEEVPGAASGEEVPGAASEEEARVAAFEEVCDAVCVRHLCDAISDGKKSRKQRSGSHHHSDSSPEHR